MSSDEADHRSPAERRASIPKEFYFRVLARRSIEHPSLVSRSLYLACTDSA